MDFNFRIHTDQELDFILKVSRPDEDENYLDFQQQLLIHVAAEKEVLSPKVIKDLEGNLVSNYTDQHGNERKVRLLTWVEGRVLADVNPQTDELRYSLGLKCGTLTQALKGFQHPSADRSFEWDVAQAIWTKNHVELFDGKEREIIQYFIKQFESIQPTYQSLRKSVVHNDANDHNVIVSHDLKKS